MQIVYTVLHFPLFLAVIIQQYFCGIPESFNSELGNTYMQVVRTVTDTGCKFTMFLCVSTVPQKCGHHTVQTDWMPSLNVKACEHFTGAVQKELRWDRDDSQYPCFTGLTYQRVRMLGISSLTSLIQVSYTFWWITASRISKLAGTHSTYCLHLSIAAEYSPGFYAWGVSTLNKSPMGNS